MQRLPLIYPLLLLFFCKPSSRLLPKRLPFTGTLPFSLPAFITPYCSLLTSCLPASLTSCLLSFMPLSPLPPSLPSCLPGFLSTSFPPTFLPASLFCLTSFLSPLFSASFPSGLSSLLPLFLLIPFLPSPSFPAFFPYFLPSSLPFFLPSCLSPYKIPTTISFYYSIRRLLKTFKLI